MVSPTSMPGVLDRTGWEFRRGAVWERTPLYRIGLAVAAAGAAESEEAAHEWVWLAVQVVGEHAPVREALEAAGIDVQLVADHLREVNRAWTEQLLAEDLKLAEREAA